MNLPPEPSSKKLARDLDLLGGAPSALLVVVPPRLPPIPDRVPCVTLWRAWASLVAANLKPIETRSWVLQASGKAPPPSGPPFWLAMHAGLKDDGKLEGAVRPLPFAKLVPAGVVFAVVLVTGIRPLKPEDAPRAHVYRDDLWAWELGAVRILQPMLALERGFQKWGTLDGRVIRNAYPQVRAKESVEDWLSADASDPHASWPVRSYTEALGAVS